MLFFLVWCGLVQEKASMRLIGTASCPRLDQAPLLEPLVCKKVSHERLTALVFRQVNLDCGNLFNANDARTITKKETSRYK